MNSKLKFNDYIFSLFKNAVLLNIKREKIRNAFTNEDERDEFFDSEEGEKLYSDEDDFIEKIVDAVDESYGKDILNFNTPDVMKIEFKKIGHIAPDRTYHDEIYEQYNYSIDAVIKKWDKSDEMLRKDAEKYFDFLVNLNTDIQKLEPYQSYSVQQDGRLVPGEIGKSEVEVKDYMISGEPTIPGVMCDCGSTYTEYMCNDMWHCGMCDNYFEN